MPHPESEVIHFLRSNVVISNYQMEEVPTFVLVDLYNNAEVNKLQAHLGIESEPAAF